MAAVGRVKGAARRPTRVRGQLQAQRYYIRALGHLPYGPGAALIHAEGSPRAAAGSGRRAPGAAPVRRGHTCVELNGAGKISRLTAIYDSSLRVTPPINSWPDSPRRRRRPEDGGNCQPSENTERN